MTRVWLDIAAGDPERHAADRKAYEDVRRFLAENSATYSLPTELDALNGEGRDVLKEAYEERCPGLPFLASAPPSLRFPRLYVDLSASTGVSKHVHNFASLCSGDKGVMKKAPHKKLHYEGCPVHRLETGFVLQSGDITRGDGSGGSSIYPNGTVPPEKEGLKVAFRLGSLAMASSGPGKPGTSQFFFCLTDEPRQLKKLDGKYVVFGNVVPSCHGTLQVLDQTYGTASGALPADVKVWIDGCGVTA